MALSPGRTPEAPERLRKHRCWALEFWSLKGGLGSWLRKECPGDSRLRPHQRPLCYYAGSHRPRLPQQLVNTGGGLWS